MTTGDTRVTAPETFVYRALAVSLAIHLLCFGGWKVGQKQGWWQRDFLPQWMQAVRNRLLTQLAKKSPPPKPKQVPLLFVDVNPALASSEPPKTPKFYGAANSIAATRENKINSNLPQIDGRQEKILKTTDNSKSKAEPLRPVPPRPKPAQKAPGDLAFAKPSDQEKKGSDDKRKAPQRRPTVAEARQKAGLTGDKMRQAGGGNRLAMESSLDVARTATGDYDWRFVQAVQQYWYKLLESRPPTRSGRVSVEFKLTYDGRITDLKMTDNETDVFQGALCQSAILNPAPYERWPVEMRKEISRDFREIRFTFYYLN